MATGNYVVYLRVSTRAQGVAGLGIEAQRKAVHDFLNGGRWKVVGEFVEVESGRRNDRPELTKAIDACRLYGACLIVAKVDRLTRSVGFLSLLLDAGVDVRFCDLPQIEGPAGRFMLNQMVAVAELEAGLISARTRAALAVAKIRRKDEGKPGLGGYRHERVVDGRILKGTYSFSEADKAASREVLRAKSKARATDLAPTIAELQTAGISSATALAKALTERGIPTARGKPVWSTSQVQRVLARMKESA